MIAMLSGTLSSPSAKLAPYKRPLTAEEAAMVRSKERKAISAVLNGFLSTVAVGVAMWWLGGSISMRTDYKAFLSVLSAIVVAATEAILYWIWQWRYKKALNSQSKRVMAQRKKIDIVGQDEIQDEAPQEAVGVITTALESGTESGARKRRGPGATETSA
ncbi:hypothetical protein FRB97_002761 [Tulasnella sp. 331]|nr:hypothetical protein FRB97_002761 [Tulasnella sp. 331]